MRYIADRLTADCSTSRFYNYEFVTFLCCIVCVTIVPLDRNRVPKLSFPCSHFMERHSCRYFSVLFPRARKRHVEAADRQHSSLSAFAPFSGALLCNRTARALLHPLPTEQGLLAERLPQPCNAACTCHLNLAGIRFRVFFLLLQPFRPIRAIQGMGCRMGGGTVVQGEMDVVRVNPSRSS